MTTLLAYLIIVFGYLAIFIFILGIAYRIWRWGRLPTGFSWGIFPQPTKWTVTSVIWRALAWPTLFRADTLLWIGAMIFHIGLLLLFIGHPHCKVDSSIRIGPCDGRGADQPRGRVDCGGDSPGLGVTASVAPHGRALLVCAYGPQVDGDVRRQPLDQFVKFPEGFPITGHAAAARQCREPAEFRGEHRPRGGGNRAVRTVLRDPQTADLVSVFPGSGLVMPCHAAVLPGERRQ